MTSTEPSANVIPSNWTTRRVILATVVVLLVALGFLLLFRFRAMILIVFAGIVVSMAMAPSVDWLQRHRLSRSVSVILIYLILLVLLIAFVVLLVPPIVEQALRDGSQNRELLSGFEGRAGEFAVADHPPDRRANARADQSNADAGARPRRAARWMRWARC